MKRTTFWLSTILILVLTACGIAANNNPSAPSEPTAGELPATTQLLLGTLKLEETDQAVTAEQAAELLPLWQTLQVLGESDTAAPQEKEALVTQIQETMTSEQMQAITDLDLSREDMMTVMQQQGTATDSSNNSSQGTSSSSNNGGGFGPGADMPPPDGGAMPGGGPGVIAGGQSVSTDRIATAQAARQAGGGNLVPTPLLNAVIEYLQKKAGA
jgi:hypothetical protein